MVYTVIYERDGQERAESGLTHPQARALAEYLHRHFRITCLVLKEA